MGKLPYRTFLEPTVSLASLTTWHRACAQKAALEPCQSKSSSCYRRPACGMSGQRPQHRGAGEAESLADRERTAQPVPLQTGGQKETRAVLFLPPTGQLAFGKVGSKKTNPSISLQQTNPRLSSCSPGSLMRKGPVLRAEQQCPRPACALHRGPQSELRSYLVVWGPKLIGGEAVQQDPDKVPLTVLHGGRCTYVCPRLY